MPFSGFGHKSGWGAGGPGPEPSGTALAEAQPQAIAPGFRGKVAIVTGGATGLGRSIAMEFGRQGCHVAFCFVNMAGAT
jgi:Dehydrogenases with different specificities (related to short-chain alcohol dehydrogenases)